jgi:peptide/nickel transport system substrate-binding protein
LKKLGPALSVIAIAILVCGLSACGSGSSGKEGGKLRVSFASFPEALDPQLDYTGEGWSAMYDTYIPLLTYAHADGTAGSEVIPGLATDMPKVTNGGKTYTLTLRKGLKYSDGTPVKASDFESTVERMYKLNSPGTSYFSVVVGAEQFQKTKSGGISGITTDDKTGKITIELNEARGTFPDELALPFTALVPPDTPAEDQTANPPAGIGPYEISSVDPGNGWSYIRNPQWKKNNAKLLSQLPGGHVNTIEAVVVTNQSTQVNEVEQGKTNWMFDPLPADRVTEVKQRYEGTQFGPESSLSTYFFWMNTTRPPFDDLKVRQAVNYAVDTDALERIYSGEIATSHQILPAGMPGYEEFDLYPHNLAKAKQLIKEADPADRQITVWTDSLSPNDQAGEYYESVLDDIGFDAKLKKTNAENYFTIIGDQSTPDLDTGWANYFADYPHPNAIFQPMFAGSSIHPVYNTNLSMIDDPKLNEKIERLATEELGPQQEDEYAALDREYMEQAPWVPYGNRALSLFVSSDIDFDKVIWTPAFSGDLASFQFK